MNVSISLQTAYENKSNWTLGENKPCPELAEALSIAEGAVEWAKIITGQQRLDLLSVFAKYACTKNPEWAYEKEWRVVGFKRQGETGHFSDYPFNARELKSIYLGCDIPQEDANDIISLIKFDFSHVRIFRAKKIERNRKLSFDGIK